MLTGFAKVVIRLPHTGTSKKRINSWIFFFSVVVSETAQLSACGCLLVLLTVFVITITSTRYSDKGLRFI